MDKTKAFSVRAAFFLMSVLMSVPVWAQLSGHGTAFYPYLINSADDWDIFCTMPASGGIYAADHYRLTADITISQSKPIVNGEFDGNGHTITINQTGDNWRGVFASATDSLYLHDLKVQGTVTTTYGAVGGLIGRVSGTRGKIIENCVVSVDFRGNHTGTWDANNTIGGFIGEENQRIRLHWVDGITLRNCVFNGSTPRSGRFDGGFVGYAGYRQNSSSNISQRNLHLENCVFAPREMSVIPNYTFSDNIGDAINLHYTHPGTHSQGVQVYDELPAGAVYYLLPIPFDNTYNYFYRPQSDVDFVGMQTTYTYTGEPINLNYPVTYQGDPLEETNYNILIKNANGEVVWTVTDIGEYRLEVYLPLEQTFARAFYVTGPLTTVNGVYQINNVADWMTLADDVAGGNSYSGATLQLNADITTDVMVGTAEHMFSGTFNGNGHTITFNKSTDEDGCAPFRYIAGATISDLNITGTVTSTGRETGGLAAYAYGTNSLSHCTVNSRITCHLNGDASNGGLIAHVHNDGGSTTFSYCTFNGCLYGSRAHSNGGFVGWGGATLTFDHCLFNPTLLTMKSTSCSTFARCNDIVYNHAYYLSTFGTAQGTRAYPSAQSSLCDKQTLGDGTEVYVVRSSSINGLAVTFEYAEGSDVNITPNVTVSYDGATLDPGKYSFNLQTVQDIGRYTLTVSGVNAEGYYGSISKNFWVARTLPTDGEGFWLIDDMNDWLSLACHVESTGGLYGGKVKMTADIGSDADPVTTMISENASYPFRGLFNGNGHTLTVNLQGYTDIGPFRYANNATIVNLHVAGIIHGNNPATFHSYAKYAGGIVASALGPMNISACRSSVDIDSNPGWDAGGFVGYNGNHYSLTITDCLFDGIIRNDLSTATGFVAYHYTDHNAILTMTNCLMNGTVVNNGTIDRIQPFYSYNWIPYPDGIQLTNCLHKFATPPNCTAYFDQGTYTGLTGEDLRAQMGDNWIVDGNGDVVPRMLTLYAMSITVADGIVHGTVDAPPASVVGEPVNLTVTPDEYYVVSSVTYNDGTDHNVSRQGNVYRFTMPNSNVTVNATFSLNPSVVPYIAYNTETNTHDTRYSVSPTAVASETTTLGVTETESWYKVSTDVTVSSRMTVHGTVNLILCDGATLTAEKGITVHNGDTLIVYGQEAGTGTLVATGAAVAGDGHESAAIGSEAGNDCVTGCITIHGGTINATSYIWTAAIGGGVGNGGGGTITLYGGTIHATADNPDYGVQEAIGKGSSGNNVNKALADGMRVTVGNNTTPVNYGDRIYPGLTNHVVTVEPCTEHNFVDNVCTYCGLQHHFIVTYDGNGATGATIPADDTILIGGDMTVTVKGNPDSLERTGYAFIGWNTAADGSGTDYAPGATFTIGEMVTLYAQWQIITYGISYNLTGGTVATPNPTTYTVEDGDITLVNPTRDNLIFLGWTGSNLDDVTYNVTIPHGSTGHRGYTATWLENLALSSGVEVDHDLQPNETGFFYVKLPYPGEEGWDDELDDYVLVGAEENPKIVNIPTNFTSKFKVYDDGGKDDYYSPKLYDNHTTTLILNAPEGKVFSVQGGIDIDYDDNLTIYDGASTGDNTLYVSDYDNTTVNIVTSGNSIRLDFYTEGMSGEGLNLTVSVIPAPTYITLANDDSPMATAQQNTSVIASNNGNFSIVTLNGRTLYRDGFWNTICLPFDIDDLENTSLQGATIKTPSSMSFDEGTGLLTTTFTDANTVEAGKPYIVRWEYTPSCNVIDGSEESNRLDWDLVDDNKESDWWPDVQTGAYCEFEANGTMEVTGYVLTTGNNLRNPNAWTLEGKLNVSDEWTLVDSRDVDVNPDDALPTTTRTDKYYFATHPGNYRYFRFTVTSTDVYTCFAELSLQGFFHTDDPDDNIENPTFNFVTIKDELHPFTSGDVSFGGNYSTLDNTDDLLLDEHNSNGDAFHATLLPPITPSAPTGYFYGWFTDDAGTTPASSIPFDDFTGDVTLYLRSAAIDYSITYNLNGGSLTTSHNSYTIESETITLDQPTRTGYSFCGWYDNSGLTGSAITTIASGSTGNKTFWARWTQNQAITDTAYQSYTWHESSYTVSGTYTYSFADANGCTQVDTLHLTIFNGLTLSVGAGGWQAISSPMNSDGVNEAVKWVDNLTSGCYDLFRYDESSASWKNQKAGSGATGFSTLERGRGYIYRHNNATTLTFTGQPNNGDFYYAGSDDVDGDHLTYGCVDDALKGFHLVGNPYPRTITFGTDVILTGCASGYYTLFPDGTWIAHPSGTIDVGEGFLIQATGNTASVSFTEPVGSKGTHTPAVLAFTVSDGIHSDVAYATLVAGDHWPAVSGLKKIGHLEPGLPMLCIPQEETQYAIAIIDGGTEAFPLAFEAATSGEYTISVRSYELGVVSYCHLVDRLTGKDVDLLRDSTYIFSEVSGQWPMASAPRFLVKLSPTTEHSTLNTGHFAALIGDQIVVHGEGTLQAYDVMGRQLFTKELQTSDFRLPTSQFPGTGVYVLRLGEQLQKVVIR